MTVLPFVPRPPPQRRSVLWVTVTTVDGNPSEAAMVDFAGDEGLGVVARMRGQAAALRELADEMDATASSLGEVVP